MLLHETQPVPGNLGKLAYYRQGAPLHVRLISTADARHAAIGAGRSTTAVRAYRGSTFLAAWTVDLLGVNSRGLQDIYIPMLIVALVASSWTAYIMNAENDALVCSETANMQDAFTLLVTALSFVLVFRLNRSATRHYEARQVLHL